MTNRNPKRHIKQYSGSQQKPYNICRYLDDIGSKNVRIWVILSEHKKCRCGTSVDFPIIHDAKWGGFTTVWMNEGCLMTKNMKILIKHNNNYKIHFSWWRSCRFHNIHDAKWRRFMNVSWNEGIFIDRKYESIDKNTAITLRYM